MRNKNVYMFLAAAIFVVVAGLGIIFFTGGRTSEEASKPVDTSDGTVAGISTYSDDPAYVEALAKFMSEKGMVMYGAFWCGHCQNQKEMFGEAFKNVDYVECDARGENANPDECQAQGVEGYPTWIFEGKKYSGEQTLEKLAEIVGFER